MNRNDSRASLSYKVCSDCGITHTPLWRGGPNGPKTMCNACGIRWKRANQSGHKNKDAKYKNDYYSEDEYDLDPSNDSSPEDIMTDFAPVSSNIDTGRASSSDWDMASVQREGKDMKDIIPMRTKKTPKRKLYGTSPEKSKPYSRKSSPERTIMNYQDLESEAEHSILLLKKAAEEIDRINNEMHIDSPDVPVQEKMENMFKEIIDLRQEVQRRDAIIDMYRAKEDHVQTSPSHNDNAFCGDHHAVTVGGNAGRMMTNDPIHSGHMPM